MTCAKCGGEIGHSDVFCPSCGFQVSDTVEQRLAKDRADRALGRARKMLFWSAVLTLLSGIILYFVGRDKVDTQIEELRRVTASMSDEERDQRLLDRVGMTFDQIARHDRGMVKLLLAANAGLAALYLGMMVWSRRKPVAATLTALLTFITVHAINAVLEPSSLAQGVIIKIVFIVILGTAVREAVVARRVLRAPAT
jgi:hypothetical protein